MSHKSSSSADWCVYRSCACVFLHARASPPETSLCPAVGTNEANVRFKLRVTALAAYFSHIVPSLPRQTRLLSLTGAGWEFARVSVSICVRGATLTRTVLICNITTYGPHKSVQTALLHPPRASDLSGNDIRTGPSHRTLINNTYNSF